MDATGKIIVALDTSKAEALRIAGKLAVSADARVISFFKLNRLIHEEASGNAEGPSLIPALADLRKWLWIDVKLHDIPRTVAESVRAYRGTRKFISVHAKGGISMMRGAVEAGRGSVKIIAITELTSLSEEEVHLGSGQPRRASVIRLANDAMLAGVRHLVCSGHELSVIRKCEWLSEMELFTPGMKSAWNQVGTPDQKQVMTPSEALRLGANRVVIGSEIVKAQDPVEALSKTVAEIEQAEEKAQND